MKVQDKCLNTETIERVLEFQGGNESNQWYCPSGQTIRIVSG